MRSEFGDGTTKQSWSAPILVLQEQSAWLERHNRAVLSARNLKAAYRDLLSVLIEIDEQQIYFQLEKTSLYSYCVELLDLPSHTAYDFIDVIRTSMSVPELTQAILDGRTTISKARRICSVITPQNQKEWINLVCECSHKIVQKAVATANPRAAAAESLKYISSDVLELRFAVSEEWSSLLTEVKDLMSQKERRNVTTEEVLFTLMTDFRLKNDPVVKAERAVARKNRTSTQNSSSAHAQLQPNPENRTRYRPSRVEHDITLRDQNRCTYADQNGNRCESRRWLDKHHVVAFADGGDHTVENLQTLCSAHHRMKHKRENLGHSQTQN